MSRIRTFLLGVSGGLVLLGIVYLPGQLETSENSGSTQLSASNFPPKPKGAYAIELTPGESGAPRSQGRAGVLENTASVSTPQAALQHSRDWSEVSEPPENLADRQAWHLAHAIPAWTDLETGLQISNRLQLKGPVSDLLDRLSESEEGVSEESYGELIAQQRQLLGTLEANHPRLFPILEPMERIEAMLGLLMVEP